MSCKHRAVIIFTREVRGTSSNVASGGRVQLTCGKDANHEGPHQDVERGEEWDDRGDKLTHILRMSPEDDESKGD